VAYRGSRPDPAGARSQSGAPAARAPWHSPRSARSAREPDTLLVVARAYDPVLNRKLLTTAS
jgi:hypothetical protein